MPVETCPECTSPLAFLDDALVSACPRCGIVIDDIGIDLQAETSAQGRMRFNDGEVHGGISQHLTSASDGMERLASASLFHRTPSEQRRLRQQGNARDLNRFIGGILLQLNFTNAQDEVTRLLQQFHVSRACHPVKGTRGHPARLTKQQQMEFAAAAIFAIVKRREPSLALEDVCIAANLPLTRVSSALVELESIYAKAAPSLVAYETPAAYIDQHIAFLARETELKPRSATQDSLLANREQVSLLDAKDISRVRQAAIDSPHFHDLAHDLAKFCAEHGLMERSAKETTIGRTRDMSLCAWAIVMHSIEGQLRKPIHEDNFARAAAWAQDPTLPAGDARYSRGQLGLDRSRQVETLGADKLHARKTAIMTTQSYVKMRYMEIRRVLSEVICTTSSVARMGNAEIRDAPLNRPRAIKALPRADVAKRFVEALLMRTSGKDVETVDDEVLSTDEHSGQSHDKTSGWSRFWSNATIAKHLTRREGGHIHEKDRVPPVSEPMASLFELVDEERLQSTSSPLAARLGPNMTSLESLQTLADDVLDRLLFVPGELDDIMYSPEDISRRRAVLEQLGAENEALAEQVPPESPPKRKAEVDGKMPDEARRKARTVNGKQTRALEQDEFDAILKSL